MRIIRSFILLAAMAIISFGLYRRTHPAAKPAQAGGPYVLQVRPIPVANNLALGDFEVPAKSTHEAKITVDETEMRNAHLTGYFSADGPGIEVMLLDETQHKHFDNQSTPAEFLFLSKKTTSGNITASMPHGGTYYLVFNNSASDSPVKVKADLTVHYETVQVDKPKDTK